MHLYKLINIAFNFTKDPSKQITIHVSCSSSCTTILLKILYYNRATIRTSKSQSCL